MSNKPDWYWEKGLHDSEIKSISYHQLDYDFTKKNPIYNYILIELDSHNALFDTPVESIKFYNAKHLTQDIDYTGAWWVKDELSVNNGKFVLTIYIQSKKNMDCLQIQFEKAEVIRNM